MNVGVDFSDALLPQAVGCCSLITGSASALKAIGVLAWFCLRIRPSVLNKFPIYLKALYESDGEVVDEATIKAWHANVEGKKTVFS